GRSGLLGLEEILGDVEGLGFVHLTNRDVVRHRIVQDIVRAYESADAEHARSRDGNRRPSGRRKAQ
ncbi:MAG: PhoH family protein, partial [Actinobacteria bacterium]|nr:PhoH family protein [Actinomycetota bacterium]